MVRSSCWTAPTCLSVIGLFLVGCDKSDQVEPGADVDGREVVRDVVDHDASDGNDGVDSRDGSDGTSGGSLEVELFAWNPDSQAFVRQIEDYPSAQSLEVRMVAVESGEVLGTETRRLAEWKGRVGPIGSSSGVRVDFALLDGVGEVLVSGSTREIGGGDGTDDPSPRVMLSPPKSFAPVGARYRASEGGSEWAYEPVSFDSRTNVGQPASEQRNFARFGHRAAVTEEGRVVVVGGGRGDPGDPWAVPSVEDLLSDVQLFDLDTNYVTDLAFDSERGGERPDDRGRLDRARAYHTVTAVGEQRFLVVGGFARRDGDLRTTEVVEVVDLEAEPGERVDRFRDGGDDPVTLETGRARHTATHLPDRELVVVVGGLADNGEGGFSAVPTVEVIDLEDRRVRSGGAQLQRARAQHTARRAGGGVWIVGGRNGEDGALKSTELVEPTEQGGSVATSNRNSLTVPRYGMSAVRAGSESLVLFGGFTSSEGVEMAPTSNCRIGEVGEAGWGETWDLRTGRGGAHAVRDVAEEQWVVLGGRGSDGEIVDEAVAYSAASPYGPVTPEGEDAGTMWRPRFGATATRLSNGNILLTGGRGPEGRALRSLEFYNPGGRASAGGE